MNAPQEGQQVALIGDDPAQGRLLAVTGSAGHVKWETGARAGSIVLTALEDLLAIGPPPTHTAAVADLWSDSLEGSAEGFSMEGAITDDVWLFGEAGDPYGDD